MKVIHDAFHDANHMDWKDNIYLRTWAECEFTDDETFEEVCSLMKQQIMCIDDYKIFLTKILNIDLIYSFKDFSHFIVCLTMTYHWLQKHLSESDVDWWYGIEKKSILNAALLKSSVESKPKKS